MIPSIEILNDEVKEVVYGNETYNIVDVNENGESRIVAYIDDVDSIKQAIRLILSTERYAFLIYSWDYGVELVDLIGKPMSYVIAELPRRIEEALLTDDRIDSVTNFEFEQHGKKLHVTFTIVTKVADIDYELEVEV